MRHRIRLVTTMQAGRSCSVSAIGRLTCLFLGGLLVFSLPASGQQDVSPVPTEARITWKPQWDVSRQRPGYPLLENVEHGSVLIPSVEAGCYHHHPQITFFQKRFYAVWSNHRFGEDGPGQQVIGATSRDGKTWQPLGPVFQPVDRIKKSFENGRVLTAAPFVQIKDRLFALAIINDSVGFGRSDTPVTGTPLSDVKTAEFGKRIRKGQGYLCREIFGDASFGTPFWIGDAKPAPTEGMPQFEDAREVIEAGVNDDCFIALKRKLSDPLAMVPWDFNLPQTECVAEDGSLLCEPTTMLLTRGRQVRYLRDLGDSMKLFAQLSADDGKTWSVPKRTDIPDSPSKTCAGRLPNGVYFLLGNQVVAAKKYRRDPLTIGLSKDGLTFEKAWAIRWRAPRFQTPSLQEEPDGRGRGFQYPDFEIVDDSLWVIYSVNKESIDVSRIPLADLKLEE